MAGIVRPEDGQHYWVTSFNFPPTFMAYVKTRPILPGRGSVAGRALLEGDVVHIADVLADPESLSVKPRKGVPTERFLPFRSYARERRSVSSC